MAGLRALAPALALILAACASDKSDKDDTPAPPAPPAEPVAADLCVSSDCGEVVRLIDIPDAENILFTPDGRLFVSGGQNVYQITKKDDGSFAARPMSEGCNFTGLAERDGYLYASCGDSRFFAGALSETPTLAEIYRFEGMCIPNGTSLGPDGRIYVVDEPLNCLEADPKIVALTVDPADPMKIARQELWIQGSPDGMLWAGLDTTFRFPNGLVRDGNVFYGTDGGSVYSVTVGNDGAAGEVVPLFWEATAHDDLGLGGSDGLLVADFFKGRILLLSRNGTLLQETDPGTFFEPSSVRLGRPPMFAPTDILVTDKGVITDENLPIDYLALFRRKAGS